MFPLGLLPFCRREGRHSLRFALFLFSTGLVFVFDISIVLQAHIQVDRSKSNAMNASCIRRTEAARCDRARSAAAAARPPSRRGDFGSGRGERVPGAAGDRAEPAGPHRSDRRAPPEHDREGRPHSRAAEGLRSRAGNALRADRATDRPLRATREAATDEAEGAAREGRC